MIAAKPLLAFAFAVIAVALASLGVAHASCSRGATACPIRVQMPRGTDTITLEGRLVQNRDCCAYVLRARAGQTLHWKLEGATVRTLITDPHGQSDGPGLPEAIPLPFDGDYVFSVHPNLMAEGAFGRFRLTLAIK